jgi:hypothetical protein
LQIAKGGCANMTPPQGVTKKLATSQPRLALMEKANSSVSIDLLVRALLALGIPRRKLIAA